MTKALAAAAIASAAVSAGATVMAAKQQANARKAELALMQQQAAERKKAIQADMLAQENEVRRQTKKTIAKINAARPYQARDTFGTTSVLAGIREEKRLAEQDIRDLNIKGLLSIRSDQIAVGRSAIAASSARSAVGIAAVQGIATVGSAAAKYGSAFTDASPPGGISTINTPAGPRDRF